MMVGSDRVAPRSLQRGATTAEAGSRPEEAFARTLREKGFAAEDADPGDDAGANDHGTGSGSSQASALTCPSTPLPMLADPSPAPGRDVSGEGPAVGPTVESTAGPTVGLTAGIEATGASAAATAARSILAPTAIDTDPTVWEASVRDGSGLAIDLRAESGPPGPGQGTAWSVTVISPALAAEILARHAPDLTDRLRRRGIASRVRIDGALEDRGDGRE